MTTQAKVEFLQYAITMSLCANGFLAAAVVCLAWLYPNANKQWLPKWLREPPANLKGL